MAMAGRSLFAQEVSVLVVFRTPYKYSSIHPWVPTQGLAPPCQRIVKSRGGRTGGMGAPRVRTIQPVPVLLLSITLVFFSHRKAIVYAVGRGKPDRHNWASSFFAHLHVSRKYRSAWQCLVEHST